MRKSGWGIGTLEPGILAPQFHWRECHGTSSDVAGPWDQCQGIRGFKFHRSANLPDLYTPKGQIPTQKQGSCHTKSRPTRKYLNSSILRFNGSVSLTSQLILLPTKPKPPGTKPILHQGDVVPTSPRFNPVSLVCEGVGKSSSLKILPLDCEWRNWNADLQVFKWVWVKIGTQNGTLVNGKVDQNQRAPCGLVLTHAQVLFCSTHGEYQKGQFILNPNPSLRVRLTSDGQAPNQRPI